MRHKIKILNPEALRQETKYEHKQIPIKFGDLEANVDEEIAELILELWRAGIATCLSCQENFKGIAWIEFPDEESLRLFAYILTQCDHSFVDKFEAQANNLTQIRKTGRWKVDVVIGEGIDFVSEDEVEGNGSIEIFYSVRFRNKEIPYMLECFKQFNYYAYEEKN